MADDLLVNHLLGLQKGSTMNPVSQLFDLTELRRDNMTPSDPQFSRQNWYISVMCS